MRAILNLSKSFRLTGHPEIQFKQFIFPGGEVHIKLVPDDNWANCEKVTIGSSMKNSEDLMSVILAADAIRGVNPNTKVDLFAPYFPYARQDRRVVPGEPFSVRVAAGLINSCNFDTVHVFDPHSAVTAASLNNHHVIDNTDFAKTAWDMIAAKVGQNNMRLVAPDAGAKERVGKVAAKIGLDQVAQGNKARDLTTGRIVKTEIIGDVAGKVCVIVDDIIDGGRTFTELAKLLRANGATQVYLVVSHGIFSQGMAPLKLELDGVFVTNSIYTDDPNEAAFVTTIPIGL